MKKILIVILTVALIPISMSCDDFEEINTSPNDVSDVDPSFLFTTNTRNIAYTYSDLGYWNAQIASTVQYFNVGDGYQSEQYNALLWTPGFASPWESIYSNLVDVQSMSDLSIEQGNTFLEAVSLVYRAIFIDMAAKLYGDVPFSEINQLEEGIVFPKYDTQKEIYETILIDLKTAKNMIEGISDPKLFILDGYDLLYGGDKSKWIKFINSLRIRMCLLLNNKKSDLSVDIDAEFRDAAQNVFTSNNDNAILNYLGNSGGTSFSRGPNNSSELTYADRMGLGFLNTLRDQNDPRLYRWLQPVEKKWDMDVAVNDTTEVTDPLGQTFPIIKFPYPDGYDLDTSLYVGLPVGYQRSWTSYNAGPEASSVEPKTTPFNSRLADMYFQNANDYVGMVVITYSEVEFIMAEAAAIGAFGVSDAEGHYKKAIVASMTDWGIFGDYVGGFDFDEYYSQEEVDLSQAANQHERIMTQKYISMFFRPEPWFDWRRTGYPDLEPPVDADQPAIPIRYLYDTPNPPDPAYVANYNEAVDRLEKTEFVQKPSKDDNRSRMWLLQGTGLPY